MSALLYPAVGLSAFYALWLFYLAVMALKRAREAGLLHISAVILGTPILIVGFLLDAFVNLFVMTVVLLDIPEEVTVTARLQRTLKERDGWRYTVAAWFIPLLDPFDPSGRHITVRPAHV